MNAKELNTLYEQEQDELLRGAIAEMRRGVNEYPEMALWYTGWRITLRKTGETVGMVAFHGVSVDKTVEIGYDIIAAQRGNGYAEEAVQSLCSWAFGRENVYFIRALADEQNGASNHILEKLKFYRVESPVSGQVCWELERPASAWLAVYMCLGLAVGMGLGSSFFDSQTLGMVIGMSAGLALGASLDSQDRAARKRDREPKKLDEEKPTEKKKK